MECGNETVVEGGTCDSAEGEEEGFGPFGAGLPAEDVPKEDVFDAKGGGESRGGGEATVDEGAQEKGDGVESEESFDEAAGVGKSGGPGFRGGAAGVDESPKEQLEAADAAGFGSRTGRERNLREEGKRVVVGAEVFGRNGRAGGGSLARHDGINGDVEENDACVGGERGEMGPEKACVLEQPDAGVEAAGTDCGAVEPGPYGGIGPDVEAGPLNVANGGGRRGKEGPAALGRAEMADGGTDDEVGGVFGGTGVGGEGARGQEVVGVDEGDEGAARTFEGGVARDGNPAVFGKDDGSEAVIAAEDVLEKGEGSGIGAIEDVEKFGVLERLPAEGNGVCPEKGFRNAEYGNDDGNERRGHGAAEFPCGVIGRQRHGDRHGPLFLSVTSARASAATPRT